MDATATASAPGLAAFAAAHLRDRTARAVYFVVATGRDRSRTSAGVAREAGADPHDVDQIMRRLAAAGVLEPSPPRSDRSAIPSTTRWPSR